MNWAAKGINVAAGRALFFIVVWALVGFGASGAPARETAGEQTGGSAQAEKKDPPPAQPTKSPLSSESGDQVRKRPADLPPLDQRLLVSDDGFVSLTFATPCEPSTLTSIVAGSTAEPVATGADPDDSSGRAKAYEVRHAWTPLFRAEGDLATGHIERLVIWSQNAITPAGMTIGQSFERASRRTRRGWTFTTGDGEFNGALVGTLDEEPHLHYVFAPVGWDGPEEEPAVIAEPDSHWELKAFIWRAH